MTDFEKNRADERIVPGIAPAASRARKPMPIGQRVLLGLLALACVALIGVSGANLADSLSVGEGKETSIAAESASGAKGESAVKSKSSAAEKASSAASSQDESAAADETSSLVGSSAAGNAPSSSVPSNASGAQSPSGSNPSSGGSSGNAAGGGQQPAVPNTVTVSVSVSSSAAGSPVSASSTLTFEKGATVYDALCGLGLSVNASSTAYGVYVAAIGGLAEKEHGGSSGWKYTVNGSYPGKSCSAYVLSDGDVVVWQYVLSA